MRGKVRFNDGGYLEGEFRHGDDHGQFVGKDAEGNRNEGQVRLGEDGIYYLSNSKNDRQAGKKMPEKGVACVRVSTLADECVDALGKLNKSRIRMIRHIQSLFYGLDAPLLDPFFGVEVPAHPSCKVRKFECFRGCHRTRTRQFDIYLADDAAGTR